LVGCVGGVGTGKVSWRGLAEVLETPVEVTERENPIALPSVRGEVEFENVTLSYGRGGPVIEEISFRVAPGETLAIVGASHKAYYERYLGVMSDIELLDVDTLLK